VQIRSALAHLRTQVGYVPRSGEGQDQAFAPSVRRRRFDPFYWAVTLGRPWTFITGGGFHLPVGASDFHVRVRSFAAEPPARLLLEINVRPVTGWRNPGSMRMKGAPLINDEGGGGPPQRT
jgi:hypothetical protein